MESKAREVKLSRYQIGLQTLAHSLCNGVVRKGMIITPKPPNAILGGLRDSIKTELQEKQVPADDRAAKTRACLDSVLLSCVFDLDGLWEVLAELDKPVSPEAETKDRVEGDGDEPKEEEKPVEEIQDSEDDESLTSPSPAEKSPPAGTRAGAQAQPDSHLPDIIVITHFSTLLTSLFTHREKSAAHNALQLLGSHLRYLTRNLATSPLVLILNSTTTSTSETTDQSPSKAKPYDDLAPAPKAMDQTLRSIFNPPPIPIPGYVLPASSRRNKPSFGLVFSQLLDLHLLCTRLPRTKQDAEAVVENLPARYVWIVECLLDEMGVWEGEMGARRSREQRWTGVDVVRGRVVNGLDELAKKGDVSDVRVAGGFGGRRV